MSRATHDSSTSSDALLPQFVIVGAQKAGSSFVDRALAAHPDIYMPPNETPVFEIEDDHERAAVLARELAPGVQAAQRGIKRPDYLARPECAERIARTVPDARLVAVLREPVSRAISAYFHYMLHGYARVESPEQGMRRLLERRYDPGYPRSTEILRYGLYAAQLRSYLEWFPREQIHLVLYDDLRADAGSALGTITRFLGVSGEITLPSRPVNRTVYSLRQLSAFDRAHRALRVGTGSGRRRVRGAVRTLQWLSFEVFPRLGARITAADLDPALISDLRAHYREDVECLRDEFGLAVGRWLA